MVSAHRYFEDRYVGSAGRLDADLMEEYLRYPGTSFRNTFHMTRESFDILAELLAAERDEGLWGQEGSASGARSVRHQLATALLALGHPAAYEDRRRDFNVSKGSLWTYTLVEVLSGLAPRFGFLAVQEGVYLTYAYGNPDRSTMGGNPDFPAISGSRRKSRSRIALE